MSKVKMSILVVYVLIAAVAVVAAGSTAGSVALNTLLILAAAHFVEMFVFFRRCQQAGGSMPAHMLNVFLFGIIHVRELNQRS